MISDYKEPRTAACLANCSLSWNLLEVVCRDRPFLFEQRTENLVFMVLGMYDVWNFCLEIYYMCLKQSWSIQIHAFYNILTILKSVYRGRRNNKDFQIIRLLFYCMQHSYILIWIFCITVTGCSLTNKTVQCQICWALNKYVLITYSIYIYLWNRWNWL